jgi:cell division protein ZipA
MSMTDLLVIIVAVLFVLVLLDGLRRKWSDRNRVVLKLDKSVQGIEVNEEEFTKSELPNGGARTKLRPGDQIPRPPKPAPKLKVVEVVQKRREQALAQNVPVLLDAVEVEEERIEHTNVFADSSAVPAGVVEGNSTGTTREEETMGIYQDDIGDSLDDSLEEPIDGLDEEFLDLTADLGADRTLVSGKGDDDEDEWEEEWDEEEDEEEDEEDDGELWEEPWEDEDDEDDEDEDEDEDDDDFDDEDDELEDDEDDEDDEDEEEDDDEEEIFPDYDEEEETWNQAAVARPQHAPLAAHAQRTAAVTTDSREASGGRVEPGFGGDVDNWDFHKEPRVGAADQAAAHQGADAYDVEEYEEFAPAAEAAPAPRKAAQAERKPMFGGAFLSKKDQGELFHEEVPSTPDEAEEELDADTPHEVIVVNVMARPGRVFEGYDLLPILQLQGMRLGDMSIFHKHSGSNGSGSVLFSMANMVKPGIFDLATMDSFVTPGVSFFLQLPNKYGNMAAFDQMLTCANAIKHALDGELKDENRSVLTRQTLEHYKQRLRDFELMLLSSRR